MYHDGTGYDLWPNENQIEVNKYWINNLEFPMALILYLNRYTYIHTETEDKKLVKTD